jgi:hypothetical protein
MAKSIALYLHFPNRVGVVSAALASEYLKRRRGWETVEIVPVNNDRRSADAATMSKRSANS